MPGPDRVVERGLADVERDVRVVEHDGGGLEQRDLLLVGAPVLLVLEHRQRPVVAGEREQALDALVARVVADVADDQTDRGPCGLTRRAGWRHAGDIGANRPSAVGLLERTRLTRSGVGGVHEAVAAADPALGVPEDGVGRDAR